MHRRTFHDIFLPSFYSRNMQKTNMMKATLLWMMLLHGGSDAKITSLMQWPAELSPLRKGDSFTLHCRLLFDHDNLTCREDRHVYWLRFGPRSGVIQAEGTSKEDCDGTQNPKRCLYALFTTVSDVTDYATYHCALAACGNILFGSGTKVDFQGVLTPESLREVTQLQQDGSSADVSERETRSYAYFLILPLSLFIIAFLIKVVVQNKTGCVSPQSKRPILHPNFNRDGDARLNTVVVFTATGTGTRDAVGRCRRT
ncbi:uncharacterized protein LOC133545886 [Nerophis ophidion]|uniref:uncharacterized protein LOC133545886 n=1 Tax=Nerophis ophidion TaxID=159077 RepID=UPI002AE097A8|nr:uncharacterized protein LOC133545886 [Nerophis ophidion]